MLIASGGTMVDETKKPEERWQFFPRGGFVHHPNKNGPP
jgi:hypothetical protein